MSDNTNNDSIFITKEVKESLSEGLVDVIVDRYYELKKKDECKDIDIQVFTFIKKPNFELHVEQIFNLKSKDNDLKYTELDLYLEEFKDEFKRVPDEYVVVVIDVDNGVLVMTKDDYLNFEEKYPIKERKDGNDK